MGCGRTVIKADTDASEAVAAFGFPDLVATTPMALKSGQPAPFDGLLFSVSDAKRMAFFRRTYRTVLEAFRKYKRELLEKLRQKRRE